MLYKFTPCANDKELPGVSILKVSKDDACVAFADSVTQFSLSVCGLSFESVFAETGKLPVFLRVVSSE